MDLIAFNDDCELIAAWILLLPKERQVLNGRITWSITIELTKFSLPRIGMGEPSVEYLRWQRKEILRDTNDETYQKVVAASILQER